MGGSHFFRCRDVGRAATRTVNIQTAGYNHNNVIELLHISAWPLYIHLGFRMLIVKFLSIFINFDCFEYS